MYILSYLNGFTLFIRRLPQPRPGCFALLHTCARLTALTYSPWTLFLDSYRTPYLLDTTLDCHSPDTLRLERTPTSHHGHYFWFFPNRAPLFGRKITVGARQDHSLIEGLPIMASDNFLRAAGKKSSFGSFTLVRMYQGTHPFCLSLSLRT